MAEKNAKLKPTALDGVLNAISIALLICMISALVFFLVNIVYQGQYSIRLMYVYGLFTFAAVLIARIAIEQSRSLSFGYAAVLSCATLLVTMRFVQFNGVLAAFALPITAAFLLLIVFLADRITFDCSLIDESEDSSGEGLLQSLGFASSDVEKPSQEDETSLVADGAAALRESVSAFATGKATKKSKTKKRHNPGVWVLYFALLALPLFGLGQLFLPAGDLVAQSRAFWFLFFYLLAAVLLLLNVSFLGLRRYLRQRNAPMPADMATTWLGIGTVATLLLLIVASLLPLPGHSAGLFDLPDFITERADLTASRFGWGPEGVENDESANNGPTSENQNPDSKNQNGEQRENGNQSSGQEDSNSDRRESGGDNKDQQSDSTQNNTSQQDSKQSSNSPDSQKNQQSNPENSKQPNDQSQRSQKSETSDQQQKTNDQDEDDSESRDNSNPQQDERELENQNPEQNQNAQQDRDRENQSERDNSDENRRQQEQEQRQREREQQQQEQNNQQRNQQPNQPSPRSPLSTSWLSLGPIIKWLTIAILLLVIVVYALTHPNEIAAMWQSFLEFWQILFGGKPKPKSTVPEIHEEEIEVKLPPRLFSSFENPFSGDLSAWSGIELVRHTFEALQAKTREIGIPRIEDETADEYLRRLSITFPEKRNSLGEFASLYNQTAYANSVPTHIETLQALWSWMQVIRAPEGIVS